MKNESPHSNIPVERVKWLRRVEKGVEPEKEEEEEEKDDDDDDDEDDDDDDIDCDESEVISVLFEEADLNSLPPS
ncbi:uncharacterized protein MONOS_10470 [Monocercomonoides exilis]|uniref:uncharacterized protein n=1 Tax=Monocercomonoides exilis TaxID=2049356 RepID=UPI003559FEAB|nr:hypothetical protein MONOS_10470 [Monocercomonoides exilis]|eukprot:MONOS_10470.1-p1 / transcript=MONOS_10470.1 / gene=MONOS_10470 / organism=Monocercomonoides_exilis_PA203 / gene_product=unspecified product / transcript_product=unspecified product / location=Mono_scaffold00477:43730-43954(+) / protein_length=75 / sequence_SO=supercontig / SO=protein_coding / is_pseudo=false